MRKVKFITLGFAGMDDPSDGYFHRWSDSVTYDDAGKQIPTTVAIVETLSGNILRVEPELITFIDPPCDQAA